MSANCKLCENTQTVLHVLAGCKTMLEQGRGTCIIYQCIRILYLCIFSEHKRNFIEIWPIKVGPIICIFCLNSKCLVYDSKSVDTEYCVFQLSGKADVIEFKGKRTIADHTEKFAQICNRATPPLCD